MKILSVCLGKHLQISSFEAINWINLMMKVGWFSSITINRGIKHVFPFINIGKVQKEVLKTEGEARGFQPSQGILQMLMNDKIMFDC